MSIRTVRVALLAGLLLPWGARSSPTEASVMPTASLSAERMAHTATMLASGDVLIAGGFTDVQRAARSAELYSPVSRRFAPLPRMVVPRHSHTATLLADGSVLIAGGYGTNGDPVVAVERFDPVRRRFEPAGRMLDARAGHTAQLLRDGRVLIAGGVGPGWTFLSSAELFDPTRGRAERVASMSVPRESHVAVTLNDGRVLIVGGHSGRRAAMRLYTSAEVYDPEQQRFTRTGDMRIRRHKHDAVRAADGRVLITGGADERDDQGAYRSTEWYDPRTGVFSMGPMLTRARYKHERSSLLMQNGDILLAGGAAEPEVLEAKTNRFRVIPSGTPLAGQFSAAARLPNGRALITGGYGNGEGPRALAWEYTP